MFETRGLGVVVVILLLCIFAAGWGIGHIIDLLCSHVDLAVHWK